MRCARGTCQPAWPETQKKIYQLGLKRSCTKCRIRGIAAERSHRENSIRCPSYAQSGNRTARNGVGNYILASGFNLLGREDISHHLTEKITERRGPERCEHVTSIALSG